MSSVRIDSGEFPLMRNVDRSHQPNRDKVYTEWSKAFGRDIPQALNALGDVIEDVYAFELWKDNYLDTPEELFERIGILDLELDEPARLIKELKETKSVVIYSDTDPKVAAARIVEVLGDEYAQALMAAGIEKYR